MATTWIARCLGLVVTLAVSAQAAAYRVEAGDHMLRGSAGGTFNFVRHDIVTRETPASLLTVGLTYDYAFADNFAVIASLRPGLADRYLSLPLGAGIRFRFPGLDAPLIPYASLEAVFSLGVPLEPPPPHLNLAVRGGIGLEYFITSNFGLGVEFALEAGPLFVPAFDLESTAELLLSCGYRF